MNGSHNINVWHSFEDPDGSLMAVAQTLGHTITRITVDDLPEGEMLVVDRSSFEEISSLIGPDNKLASYLKTVSVVYVLRPGERFYTLSMMGTKSIAAYVPAGDIEALIEATCPMQLDPRITEFVDRFGPPNGFPLKANYEVMDFEQTPIEVMEELSSCDACKASVMAQIHDLELELLINNMALSRLSAINDVLGQLFGGFESGVDDEEVEQVADQLYRLANNAEPKPDDDPEVTAFFSRLLPETQAHLAECESSRNDLATIFVDSDVEDLSPEAFVFNPHDADEISDDSNQVNPGAMSSSEREVHLRQVFDSYPGLEKHSNECSNCHRAVELFLNGEDPGLSMVGLALMGKSSQLDDVIGSPIGSPFAGSGVQVIPVDLSSPELSRSILEDAGAPPAVITTIMGLASAANDPEGVDPSQDI